MSFDPYATLGVARDVDDKDLKAAFKRRSKETHPDVNGTGEDAEFKLVNQAYALLSNPDARSFYDQTGLVQEVSEEKIRAEMFKLIKLAFDETIKMFFDQSVALDGGEVLRHMQLSIANGVEKMADKIKVVKSQIDALEKMKADIDGDRKGENIFVDRLAELVIERQTDLVDHVNAHRCLTMSTDELAKYKSSTDMMKNIFRGFPSNSTTSTNAPWNTWR